jgi:hypothetical protein
MNVLPQDFLRKLAESILPQSGGVKDLLCFRSSELSPVKEKQDDTDRGKNEADSISLHSYA